MTDAEKVAAQKASRANGGPGPSDGGMGIRMREAQVRAEMEVFLTK